MSTELEARIAALPPEKRELLKRRLAREGLDRSSERRRTKGGRTIPRRAEGPGPWPLSYGQRRLWFIDRLNPGSPAYNIPFAGRLAGPLRADLLARSLHEVIRRHQVLRSRFVEEDGHPVQVIDPIAPAGAARLPVVDLSRLPESRRDAEADRLRIDDPQHLFDLARGPAVRLTLLRLTPTLHDLLVTMPHIVTDAWSMAILFRELPAIYDAYRRGRPSPLADPPVQVADFALWERERLDGTGEEPGRLGEELDFWRRHLAGAPTVLELPTDRPRPPVHTMRGLRRAVALPAETTRRLEALADREGATLFMALLASFAVALSRWTGQDDLLLASPLATRGEPEVQGLIGFFIDNAVLRVDLSGDPGFRELLARVRESSLATFAHQGAPFEKVAEAVGAGGDLSRPPLAQVNFVLQNVHIPAPEFEELSLVRAQQTDTRSSRFDLGLGLFEDEGGLSGWFEYATDLFDETTIARLERDWLDGVDAVLEHPDAPLSALARLRPEVRQQMLVEWNHVRRAEAPREVMWEAATTPEGAHELVARWCRRTPDAVALETVEGGPAGRARSITYGELDRRASALAERLRPRVAGVPEPAVALTLGRSPELVVAMLAVWRVGGHYVPVDPGYPEERRRLLLGDADAVVTIGPGLTIEAAGRAAAGDAGGGADADPERLAYLLYTSGSTGVPKGVAVPHRGIVRLVRDGCAGWLGSSASTRSGIVAGVGPGDAFLALAPVSFDASTFELWGAVANGARLAFFPEELPTVDALDSAMRRHRVTVSVLTTSVFHLLAERRPEIFREVRHVCPGGEALSPALARRVLAAAPEARVHNGYGPTENTVYTTVHELASTRFRGVQRAAVPLGRPIPGTRVMILDRDLRPTPLGAAGELVTGGDGLARGYHRRPGRTATSFVPDPFQIPPASPRSPSHPEGGAEGRKATPPSDPDGPVGGARLYRTGDLARWLPDGVLEFLGRADRQVKVRGFRVEPGEVETALAGHPGVAAAAVVLRDGRLAAYVTGPGAADPPETAELKSFLAGRLPDFMVPTVFVPMESLPLSANGKLDRAALPDPRESLGAAAGADAGPEGEAEEILAAVWREVLGLERVGVHDRFFDLGGDSILAIRVISRAAEEGLTLEARQLFEHPTIAALARVAVRTGAGAGPAYDEPVVGPVPLGPAQRWFFRDLAPPASRRAAGHWNLAVLLAPADAGSDAPGAPGGWRLDRMAAALGEVLGHHDMLRARFVRGDGAGPDGWRQEVVPPEAAEGAAAVAAVDLSGLPEGAARGAFERALADAQRSLDLTSGPTLRWLRLDPPRSRPESARLLLVAHHLVTDAVSLRILLEDLGRAWTRARPRDGREEAAPLHRTAPYRDWVAALAAWAASPAADAERARLRELAGAPGPEGAPESRPSIEAEAETVEAVLPEDATAAVLSEAGETLRARVEEVVLAGVAAALAGEPAAGDRTLRIDVEGHGRALPEGADGGRSGLGPDLSRTVGWFTALRPVVVGSATAARPAQALRTVKDSLRAVADGGVGHAALRWLAADGTVPPPADLAFNFLGRIDFGPAEEAAADGTGGAPFRLAPSAEDPGPLRHPRARRPCSLELTAYLRAGELHTVWTFDRTRRSGSEVEALAGRALDAVRELAGVPVEREPGSDHARAAEAIAPSDFPHAGLDDESLDRLLGKLGGE